MTADEECLFEWTRTFLDFAAQAGFVTAPFRLAEREHEQVISLYRGGLSPSDAAEAFYSVKH
jgi:hypothetical protein